MAQPEEQSHETWDQDELPAPFAHRLPLHFICDY
jgi:hypothetical protein